MRPRRKVRFPSLLAATAWFAPFRPAPSGNRPRRRSHLDRVSREKGQPCQGLCCQRLLCLHPSAPPPWPIRIITEQGPLSADITGHVLYAFARKRLDYCQSDPGASWQSFSSALQGGFTNTGKASSTPRACPNRSGSVTTRRASTPSRKTTRSE